MYATLSYKYSEDENNDLYTKQLALDGLESIATSKRDNLGLNVVCSWLEIKYYI